MPEQLKPCPACGSRGVICILDDDEMYSVDCGNCAMRGPAEHYPDFAEAAWNKLPRRPDYNDVDCAGCPERRRGYLTWTTEPPKVVGRFWWRDDRHPNEADILNVTQTTLEWFQHNRLCPHEQFAGPIPEPKE